MKIQFTLRTAHFRHLCLDLSHDSFYIIDTLFKSKILISGILALSHCLFRQLLKLFNTLFFFIDTF